MRKYVIIPDSAHGTNPATAATCGYKIKVVKTNKEREHTINNENNLFIILKGLR